MPASAQVGTTVLAPDERETMPDISGTTLDGSSLDLASLRGKVVVLNAWASWCPPCKAEVPAFVALHDRVDPAKVAVVGLDVEDEPTAAAAFAKEQGMTYPSIVDADGTLLPTIPKVPPADLPSTVVIDPQGRIAARIIGATNAADLGQIVHDVLAESSDS